MTVCSQKLVTPKWASAAWRHVHKVADPTVAYTPLPCETYLAICLTGHSRQVVVYWRLEVLEPIDTVWQAQKQQDDAAQDTHSCGAQRHEQALCHVPYLRIL